MQADSKPGANPGCNTGEGELVRVQPSPVLGEGQGSWGQDPLWVQGPRKLVLLGNVGQAEAF